MVKIRDYPDRGDLYRRIISKAYLNRLKYKEAEMLEVTYYDRKKGIGNRTRSTPAVFDFASSKIPKILRKKERKRAVPYAPNTYGAALYFS